MEKRRSTISVFLAFFMGVVVGFLLAPMKKGYGGFGNNSGNTTNYYFKDKNDEE